MCVEYLNLKKLSNTSKWPKKHQPNTTPSHQPSFDIKQNQATLCVLLPVPPCLANTVSIYMVTAHVVSGKGLHPINQRRLFDDVHLSVEIQMIQRKLAPAILFYVLRDLS